MAILYKGKKTDDLSVFFYLSPCLILSLAENRGADTDLG